MIDPARNNPEFQVVAVAARDRSRAKAFAAKHGVPHVSDGYSELIARTDIDLVYVALPPAAHKSMSIEAVKSGKAVLCEKPFSMNAAEARALVSAAAEAKQPLIEAFHNRFHRLMRRAVEIVASGELGRLVEAETVFDVPIPWQPDELRWTVSQGGGGALMDLGCYCIHALRTLAACEPKVVSARCTLKHGVDASTQAELLFSNGMTAKLRTSMVPNLAASLLLKGEKGRLELFKFVAPQNGGQLTVEIGGKTRIEPVKGPSTYDAQLAHVGDVLLRGAPLLTGGADAVANMECIDAIYAAAGFERAI